jgi:hypothetical protein
MWRAAAVLVFAVSFTACTANSPPPEPSPTAGPVCKTADDCVVSPFSGPDDCCGSPCTEPYAYPKNEIARLHATLDARCAEERETCPEARCMMRQSRPDCVEGRCVSVDVTEQAPSEGSGECTRDDECAKTTLGDDCCDACEAVAGTKETIDAKRRACEGRAGGPPRCPQLDCPHEPADPKCVAGTCTLVPR